MTAQSAHKFAFGKNWEKFSDTASDGDLNKAADELGRLAGDLADKSFLDIGSGSGLHALAALRLGAKSVVAFDVDADSVRTTQKMLRERAPGNPAEIIQKDILTAVSPGEIYDTVYSWGVLHHTGDMWMAIENASRFVAPGGDFIIAIYKKTPLCGFWKAEKSFYSRLPVFFQWPITFLFSGLYLAGITLSGRNPVEYVRSYSNNRGMNFWRDMVDWLGGYPYESASLEEIEEFVSNLGFRLISKYNDRPCLAWGLFGSGCAEYVFKRAG